MIEPLPVAEPRPPLWPAVAGFAALLVAVTTGQLAVAAVVALQHLPMLAHAPDRASALIDLLSSGPLFVVNIAVTCVAVSGTALVAARLLGEPLGVRLRLGPSRLGALGYAASLVGILALGNALEGLTAHLPIPTFSLPALSAAAHGPLRAFVPLVVIGALGAGFGEELFFRGFLAQVLRRRWGRTATIVVTAAGFGLLHGDPLHSPLAFVLGLYLGWVAEEAQSIRPTVFAHVLNNATSFLSDRYDLGQQAQGPLGIVGSLGLLAACMLLLRRSASEGAGAVLPAKAG